MRANWNCQALTVGETFAMRILNIASIALVISGLSLAGYFFLGYKTTVPVGHHKDNRWDVIASQVQAEIDISKIADRNDPGGSDLRAATRASNEELLIELNAKAEKEPREFVIDKHVENAGRLNHRQNGVIMGIGVAMVGGFMLAAGSRKETLA
jgi:hypothetical protein